MDSIAYSVMLEIKANTTPFKREVNDTIKNIKNINKAYNENINKTMQDWINQHKSLNKVAGYLKSTYGKISSAIGYIYATIRSVVSSIVSAVSIAINAIANVVIEAMNNYSELVEKYRFANIQAAGGVSVLYNSMTNLEQVMGATREEAEQIIFDLVEVGFVAVNNTKRFNKLAEAVWGFSRVTGVAASTVAAFLKSLSGVGILNKSSAMLEKFVVTMQRAKLTSSELSAVMDNVRSAIYQLEIQFGTGAIDRYVDKLSELSGAAKMVGIDVREAGALMSDIMANPLKFVIITGGASAVEDVSKTIDIMVNNIDSIKGMLEGIPGPLREQVLNMYGINSTQLKMLESVKRYRTELEKYPYYKSWVDALNEANSSLSRLYEMMRSKVMAAFERLGGKLGQIRIMMLKVITEAIPERLSQLTDRIATALDNAIGSIDLESFGKNINKWLDYAVDAIETIVVWMIDAFKWVIENADKIKKAFSFIADIMFAIYRGIVYVCKAIEGTVDKWQKSGEGIVKLFTRLIEAAFLEIVRFIYHHPIDAAILFSFASLPSILNNLASGFATMIGGKIIKTLTGPLTTALTGALTTALTSKLVTNVVSTIGRVITSFTTMISAATLLFLLKSMIIAAGAYAIYSIIKTLVYGVGESEESKMRKAQALEKTKAIEVEGREQIQENLRQGYFGRGSVEDIMQNLDSSLQELAEERKQLSEQNAKLNAQYVAQFNKEGKVSDELRQQMSDITNQLQALYYREDEMRKIKLGIERNDAEIIHSINLVHDQDREFLKQYNLTNEQLIEILEKINSGQVAIGYKTYKSFEEFRKKLSTLTESGQRDIINQLVNINKGVQEQLYEEGPEKQIKELSKGAYKVGPTSAFAGEYGIKGIRSIEETASNAIQSNMVSLTQPELTIAKNDVMSLTQPELAIAKNDVMSLTQPEPVVTPNVPVKSEPTPSGAVGSAKADIVSTSTPQTQQVDISGDGFKYIEKIAKHSERQVEILDNIANRIGDNKYIRNSPDKFEVSATSW